jgi:chitinase
MGPRVATYQLGSKAEQCGSNEHITEVKLRYKTTNDPIPIYHQIKAYDPAAVEALARWGRDTGKWVLKNSDSLTLYAMARYVQKNALGNNYPHLPLAFAVPDQVTNSIVVSGFFGIHGNGPVSESTPRLFKD